MPASPDDIQSLQKAAERDQRPLSWYNLAKAFAASGDFEAELESLNKALARDAYFLPALLAKGSALRNLGREAEGLKLYRSFLMAIPRDDGFPEPIRAQLAEAREIVRLDEERRLQAYRGAVSQVSQDFPGSDLSRATAYAEQRAGRRKVYVQQPTAGHFPYLPALEFFDRKLFPWLGQLEQQTGAIRHELLSLWEEQEPNFKPYVGFEPGAPVNQWAELNHSARWSAWFLWENGVRNEENCIRSPATAAAVEALPLLDIPGKGPTVMFSVLKPKTRIPPHTGSTNARTTVHLPLVVPDGCGFRVGSRTRQWVEGEAWAFDDTIEHEAWNDSDQPRAILIVDAWNPLLTEAERALVRAIG